MLKLFFSLFLILEGIQAVEPSVNGVTHLKSDERSLESKKVTTTEKPPNSCTEDGLYYFGASPTLVSASSTRDCYLQCDHTWGCRLWSKEKASSNCWLMTRAVYMETKAGMISGKTDCWYQNPPTKSYYVDFVNRSSTICEGKSDFPGTVIKVLATRDKRICHDLCADDTNCKIYKIREIPNTDMECTLVRHARIIESEFGKLQQSHATSDACSNRSFHCFGRSRYSGGSFRNVRVAGSECYKLCLQSNCKLFYKDQRNQCWLSSTREGVEIPDDNYVTGYDECLLRTTKAPSRL